MKTRIAIIGAGYMAQEYLRALMANEKVEVVGIFARNRAAAVKMVGDESSIYIADSINDLFNNTNAEGVIVAVAELATLEILDQVFMHPWISLVEKPVGVDLETAQKIVDLASQFQRISLAALNRRYYSSTSGLLDDVKEKRGTRIIRINDQEDLISAQKSNRPSLVVKNWMHTNSIHLIDFFSFLGRGEVSRVVSERRPLGKETFLVESHLDFSSGDLGIYTCYWNTPSGWSINLNIENFESELKPLENYRSRTTENMSWKESPISDLDIKFKPGLYLMCEDFVNFLQGLESRMLTIKAALETRNLIHRIYQGIDL